MLYFFKSQSEATNVDYYLFSIFVLVCHMLIGFHLISKYLEEYLVQNLWVGWKGVLKSPITISFSKLDLQFIVIKILPNRSSNCYELSQNIYPIDLYKVVKSILFLVFPEDLQKWVSKMFLNYNTVEDVLRISLLFPLFL